METGKSQETIQEESNTLLLSEVLERKDLRIAAILSNAGHWKLKKACVVHYGNVYRLVTIHDGAVDYDETYDSLNGAKIAFTRLYEHNLIADNIEKGDDPHDLRGEYSERILSHTGMQATETLPSATIETLPNTYGKTTWIDLNTDTPPEKQWIESIEDFNLKKNIKVLRNAIPFNINYYSFMGKEYTNIKIRDANNGFMGISGNIKNHSRWISIMVDESDKIIRGGSNEKFLIEALARLVKTVPDSTTPKA